MKETKEANEGFYRQEDIDASNSNDAILRNFRFHIFTDGIELFVLVAIRLVS